ncbi:XRE family transcriptional regulator [Brevibacillus ruminantium]|uniref:XRE family transcriptional regulator n=1 Tax=Brevibacillus ruminantium TaxID=2950604 RepID=A0ABY4WKN5_9BACL|nr:MULTISPECIES: XRE family transcriptional regulator [Brevibacillus]USG65216.1 XRE family transcriptional regulator [Brevibacillus ruminantium]
MKDVSRYVGMQIRKYRKMRNMTQKELGLKIGVKHNTISSYEAGTNEPEQNTLFAIADALGVSINDLFPKINEEISNLIPLPREVRPIPIIGVIACGDPIFAEQNVEDYRYEVVENLPSGKLYYLYAKGDSMSPTIPSNSLVLIREQPTVESGQIAAVLLNGDTEATLKRIKWQGDIMILMPDNPAYEPIVATNENQVRIIGRAIKYSVDL